jgi:hypothetical protein
MVSLITKAALEGYIALERHVIGGSSGKDALDLAGTRLRRFARLDGRP